MSATTLTAPIRIDTTRVRARPGLGRLVALFALPSAWMAVVALSFFADIAPWADTGRALGPMTEEVLSAEQWAHAGSALAIWMALPLLIGIWRFTRGEVTA